MKFTFDDDGKTSEMPINPEKVNPFEEVCQHEYLADGGPCTKCHKTVADTISNRVQHKAIDIQASKAPIEMHLAKVGINELHAPIKYKMKDGDPIKLETNISAYVDLTPEVKGINMSRISRTLYKYIEEDKDISTDLMVDILTDFQAELHSENAYLKFRFSYPIKKKSLITDNYGWSYYPVEFETKLVKGELTCTMMVSIYYSSTCPCSNHLSEQLKQNCVIRDGATVSIQDLSLEEQVRYQGPQSGTAHAQRSRADVKIKFSKENPVWIEDVVATIENALQTPVQVIVKREDEQEFARLCAQNLMFCEDAARRMSEAIDKLNGVCDWFVVANHFESLHLNNAIAVNWKGIKDGLR